MVNIEEEDVSIAAALARLSDEESGLFSSQKPVRINRTGYNIILRVWFCSGGLGNLSPAIPLLELLPKAYLIGADPPARRGSGSLRKGLCESTDSRAKYLKINY